MTEFTVSEGCAWTTRVLEEVRTKKWRGGITGGQEGRALLEGLEARQIREIDAVDEVVAVVSSCFRLEGRSWWPERARAAEREADMRWNGNGE
jgi:hypothetical protein